MLENEMNRIAEQRQLQEAARGRTWPMRPVDFPAETTDRIRPGPPPQNTDRRGPPPGVPAWFYYGAECVGRHIRAIWRHYYPQPPPDETDDPDRMEL